MGWITDAMAPPRTSMREESTRPQDRDAPIPLFASLPEPEPYPIEALGGVLAEAAAAICRKIQVPNAIAAQSVLAAAALTAQALADVELPYGQKRPLSLFFLSIAGSGDRKTSADNEALWPIRQRESALNEKYRNERHAWDIADTVWSAEKKKIETNRKINPKARKESLFELGPRPIAPLYPVLTAPDPTVEGLIKSWVSSPASLGIFSAEGGQFVGGYGMAPENRLRTAATISQLWDGQPLKRIRASDGVTILNGRRLSMHLMIQPDAAAQFIGDPLLRNQGLLSRFLVAGPASLAGKRFFREPAPEDNAALKSYRAHLLRALERPWPLVDGKPNELDPPPLVLDPRATEAWRAFYNHVEGQCGSGSDLAGIQDFTAKAAELAIRVAGVLNVHSDLSSRSIGPGPMAAAITLIDWYVNETLRLHRGGRTDPRLLRAQSLLGWLKTRGYEETSVRDIVRLGPSALRSKAAAEEALGILLDHGWIEKTSNQPKRYALREDGEVG